MREGAHQLHSDPLLDGGSKSLPSSRSDVATHHRSLERKIFDDDILADDRWADTEADVKHNLGIDLALGGGGSHVCDVVGDERDLPLHHDDI